MIAGIIANYMTHNILQGDIILLPYPFTDIQNSKQRPAVVLSANTINKPLFIVAKITSTIYDDRFSFLLTNNLVTQALPKISEIRTNELFTAHHSIITKKFGALRPPVLQELLRIVKSNFDV
jgi:mRNA interferase MazF